MATKKLVFEPGALIYSPFLPKREVFVVQLGYVMAFTHDDNGKRRIHLIYGPGSFFPVITTFKDAPQRASYEALTRVAAAKYSRAQFLQQVKEQPDFANDILRKTVDQLSIFADIVVNLQSTRLEDKLLNRLQSLAKTHGQPDAGGLALPYKLKHHHLSDMLGSERESVSRVLGTLRSKGLVTKNPSGYLVIKPHL